MGTAIDLPFRSIAKRFLFYLFSPIVILRLKAENRLLFDPQFIRPCSPYHDNYFRQLEE